MSSVRLFDGGEFIGHRLEGDALDAHRAVLRARHDRVVPGVVIALALVVLAEVGSSALAPVERAAGDRFGDHEQVVEVEGGVPAGVVLAVALGGGLLGAGLEFGEPVKGRGHIRLVADDADLVLHHVLQVVLDVVRVLAALVLVEGREGLGVGVLDLGPVDRRRAMVGSPLGGVLTRELAEHEQV